MTRKLHRIFRHKHQKNNNIININAIHSRICLRAVHMMIALWNPLRAVLCYVEFQHFHECRGGRRRDGSSRKTRHILGGGINAKCTHTHTHRPEGPPMRRGIFNVTASASRARWRVVENGRETDCARGACIKTRDVSRSRFSSPDSVKSNDGTTSHLQNSRPLKNSGPCLSWFHGFTKHHHQPASLFFFLAAAALCVAPLVYSPLSHLLRKMPFINILLFYYLLTTKIFSFGILGLACPRDTVCWDSTWHYWKAHQLILIASIQPISIDDHVLWRRSFFPSFFLRLRKETLILNILNPRECKFRS